MMVAVFWHSLLLACVACSVTAEVFTSLAHLEATFYAERDIATTLKSFISQERSRLDQLEKIAIDYEKHSAAALQNPNFYLANPVNAFLLIKRFTLDWDHNVAPILNNNTWNDFNQDVQFARQDLPSFEDLTGAAIALMRLQDTYHLDTSKVAHGNLGGVMSTSLSVDDCFDLAKLSYDEGDFYHTAMWVEEALAMLGNHESRKDKHVEMLDYLAFSYYKVLRETSRDVIVRFMSFRSSTNDCFLLGRLSYTEKDFYHTILWMQEALDLDAGTATKESEVPSLDRKDVLDYLSYSLAMQGYVKHALTLTKELLTLDPTHTRAFNNKRYFEDMLIKQGEDINSDDGQRPAVKRVVDEYRQSKEFQTYEALCRGETTQKIKDEHKLKCRYIHNNHPLLILSPVKLEEMHLDPWIVLIHDIISDSQINDIKILATPKLNRATVQNSQTGQLETATYRISKSAWLKDGDHPTIMKLNHRIEAITGLDVSTAEELQIANYGLGGHYEPHFDFARNRKYTALEKIVGNRIATYLIYKEEKEAFKSLGTGNRIATYLAYMTDVEAGGATVFPYLGLKLFPKKGSAAFWYNLYRNGDGIYNTRHAACPVLVGVKWVANKWFHERGQEWRRSCSLSPDE